MDAIVFDFDTRTLRATYRTDNWRNADNEVGNILGQHGFEWQQGSTYFGTDRVDAVTCVLAVQDLTAKFAWFAPSVRDIRMLRIEENNDFTPAIQRVQPAGGS